MKKRKTTIAIPMIAGILLSGCTKNNSQSGAVQPFSADSGTVFLASFDDNSLDQVSKSPGSMVSASFVPALFRSGLKLHDSASARAICRFPVDLRLAIAVGTLEALVEPESLAAGFNHIIDKSWLYGLSIRGGTVAACFGTQWWYSTWSLPLHQWSYVAASFDGNLLRLYLNGEIKESVAYVRSGGNVAYDLGIGNASDSTFRMPFRGIVDEVRISNRARTAGEISRSWSIIKAKIDAGQADGGRNILSD